MTNTAAFHLGDPLLAGLDMLEVISGYPDLTPMQGGKKRRKSRSKSTKKVKRARKGKMKKSRSKSLKSRSKSRKTNRKKSRKMGKRKNSSKGKRMRGGSDIGLAAPTCSR